MRGPITAKPFALLAALFIGAALLLAITGPGTSLTISILLLGGVCAWVFLADNAPRLE